jgi:hypothetical protein
MNRIRTILKGEISDLRVSQEAVLAINKAAVDLSTFLYYFLFVCYSVLLIIIVMCF